MPETRELPRKRLYRVSEVCQYTDTQPYVLSFWESEFPQLNPQKSRGGQSMYRKEQIDLVLRIKDLLYQQEYTIAAAREHLERELGGRKGAKRASSKPRSAASRGARPVEAAETAKETAPGPKPAAREKASPPHEPAGRPAGPEAVAAPPDPAPDAGAMGSVTRERYEDALDEIAHLRLQLQDAETRLRKAESAVERAEEHTQEYRERSDRTIERLEKLLSLLS